MPHQPPKIVEIYGDGITDVGPHAEDAREPTEGVVPILVHKLCQGAPMLVKTRHLPRLNTRPGTFEKKLRFAATQAKYNPRTVALAFIVDSEGDVKVRDRLVKARDQLTVAPPTAVGVAHACIEAWLLADAAAICRVRGIAVCAVPDEPESLPSPGSKENRRSGGNADAKSVLTALCGAKSAAEKWAIVRAIADLPVLRKRCAFGFGAFATEVEVRIAPLFA